MRLKRIAFCGPSGSGKTTLTDFIANEKKFPVNPIGSRSVAKTMGFDNPYDVDKHGKRAEFQNKLLREKIYWEVDHHEFVTDRTTLDNLAYAMLHDAQSIDAEHLCLAIQGFRRYTHVIYCPFNVFCEPGNDAARKKDMTYHELYDVVLEGLLSRHVSNIDGPRFWALREKSLQDRQDFLRTVLDL